MTSLIPITSGFNFRMPTATPTLETLVALAKRRGFIFQGSEIYGGLAGTWDYGPYGVLLKNNIKALWWSHFVTERENMYGLDTAILMNPRVWEASGHTSAGFADPLVEDLKNNKRYRADHLLEENGVENVAAMTMAQMSTKIKQLGLKSPDGNELSEARMFNMMFSTQAGPIDDTSAKVYLRPETAQGMFVNFKNILDSIHPRLPFGIAQIGKNFRNEITPRDFIFRVRELEIMEYEYFIEAGEWEDTFAELRQRSLDWFERIGLDLADIHELDVPEADRAHYSSKSVDFEYKFSIGVKEIGAVAYRTDFDLSNHTKHSGTDLSYLDPDTGKRFIPHVLEPTFGLDRHVLAVMTAAYREEPVGEGDTRVVLGFKPSLAPVRIAVSPLLRNKPDLVAKAREVFITLKSKYGNVMFDDNGNIGKRYRRQDEIGTPLCVVIDFDTLKDAAVTVRHRDTMAQTRIKIAELPAQLDNLLEAF
jgi:glycyl-tRNA synthetase